MRTVVSDETRHTELQPLELTPILGNRAMTSRLGKMAAIVVMTSSIAASALGQTEGIKETDRFIKAGDATLKAIDSARAKSQNALGAYNALLKGDVKDMKGDYKTLQKSQQEMVSQVADAQKAVDQMDKEAAIYFAARSTAIGQIEDVSLRAQAKARLEKSQKGYQDVKAALRGSDPLTPFTKDLSDQIKYLGAELTPSAAASLKPQAEKLNTRGAILFGQVNTAMSTATAYFESLRTQ